MAVRRKAGKAGPAKIEAWSFSRFNDYESCPLMAKFKHVDRIKVPPNDAMKRGSHIHKLCEDYVKGAAKELPEELEAFREEFEALRGMASRMQLEAQIAVDRKWEPCDWFSPKAWLRVVYDSGNIDPDDSTVFIVRDYKTGKIREEKGIQQLGLYAPAIFAHVSDSIETIRAELWYLDAGEIIEQEYARTDAPRLAKQWEKDTKKMLADTAFKPTPGRFCTWCDFSKDKLGKCEY